MPSNSPIQAKRSGSADRQFSERDLSQLRSYVEFYDQVRHTLNARLQESLMDHAVMREIISRLSEEDRKYQQELSRQKQREAVYEGKWQAYTNFLHQQGAAYANLNLEFEDWLFIISRFKRILMGLIKEQGDLSFDHVLSIVEGMDQITDFTLSAIADSYLDEKNRQIREERDEKSRLLNEAEQARQRLDAILQNSSDHILVIDEHGTIESINHVAQGFTKEDILGTNLFELQSIADRDVVETIVKEVFDKGEANFYDVDVHTKESTLRFANSVGPIRGSDGSVRGAVIVSRDITPRMKEQDKLKQTLEELKEAKERFELAMNGSSAGIWDWDIRTDEVFYSSRFKALLGYEEDEFENKFESLASHLHPDDKEKIFQQIDDTFKNDTVYDVQYRSLTKNGDYKWFLARGSVLRDEDGDPYRMAGSIANIDAQKRLEFELRELNKNLERIVSERTARLKEINEELEGFSYTVSHDLRAPLRAIDGFSRILVKKLDGQLDESQQHYLDVIIENVGRMGELIDDLLAFSRMGRKEKHLLPFEIGELADQVMDELSQGYEASRIQFTNEVDITIQGDREMIKVVLNNLLGNALKFSSNEEESKIRFCYDEKEDVYEFHVIDNGVGFESEYSNKLFQIFQRLHSETEFEGTGVGLAIVQRIIHRHEGHVTGNCLERGAKFSFTLPKNKINPS